MKTADIKFQDPKTPNPKRKGGDPIQEPPTEKDVETPIQEPEHEQNPDKSDEPRKHEQQPDPAPPNETLEKPGVFREDLVDPPQKVNPTEENASTLDLEPKANLNQDDLDALGPVDLSMDRGDDEQLAHRVEPVDFSGDDLDVPGAELDDAREGLGSEDEENNSYSIGGDDHNDLEESNPDIVR